MMPINVVRIMKKPNYSCLFCIFIFLTLFYFKKDKILSKHLHTDTKLEFESTTKKIAFRLVTAFSENHFNEAIRGCLSVGYSKEVRDWENGFMIAYLLSNISHEQLITYKKACPFVEIRKFAYEKYPNYFKNLFEYRWKPAIIFEMLQEFDNIFYFDSSIVFNEDSGESINNLFAAPNASTCGLRQFVKTDHTIFAATEPTLFKLFNFDSELAKQHIMYGATYFSVMKNTNSLMLIKKWIECAKEKYCMAPVNSRLKCDMPKLLRGEYANCHRYDQAVLAILLVQHCEIFNNYFLESKLIEVKRFVKGIHRKSYTYHLQQN